MEHGAGMCESVRRSIAATVFICIWLLWVPSGSAAEGRSQGYCVLPVGDINSDGIEDVAVSAHGKSPGRSATAYMIIGGPDPLPQVLDSALLKERAVYILRGPTAAPFACRPPKVDAKEIREKSSRQTNGSKGSVRRKEGSPMGQPVYYGVGADLRPLSPGYYVMSYGVDPHGQVVGNSWAPPGYDHAFIYDGLELRDLGTLGGHASYAYAINGVEEVVGYSLTGDTDELGFVHHAFVWDGLVMQDLAIGKSDAADINDRGHVVGAFLVDDGEWHAYLHQDGQAADLGVLLDGWDSFALAVNESGQVVGEAVTFGQGPLYSYITEHGFLYENGVMHDLGTIGRRCFVWESEGEQDCWDESSATDINEDGRITGFSSTDEGSIHAFLMSEGILEDLGTLGGRSSWAFAVNDSDQVVGSSLGNDGYYHPFLYDTGIMYDLLDLIADMPNGFSMWGAHDINNFGQIAGQGYRLDPLYESISRNETYAFTDSLGAELTFEYWSEINEPNRCVERARPAVIEYRIDPKGLGPGERGTLSGRLGGWHSIEGAELSCQDSENWRTASIPIPLELKESEVGIKIRIKHASGIDPTVYFRHFR